MFRDEFLLRWLLETNFNVKEAAERLKNNLEWRAAQSINSILDENWEDMHANFPYTRDTTDKFGRPVLYYDGGNWNVAKFLSEQESGKERLERYFYKLHEESEQHVRDLQAQGKNVTQFVMIVNIDGFNLEKHGCLQCLLFYRNICQTLDLNFPFAVERSFIVNAPYISEIVFSYLHDKNRKAVNILGRDKSILEKTLLETIDQNQIPRDLLEQQTHFI